MIVKQPAIGQVPVFPRRFLWVAGGFLVLVLLALLLKFFVNLAPGNSESAITCGAEDIKFLDGKTVFVNEGHRFLNGHTQSSEQARTGRYSSLLRADEKYGMLYNFEGAQPGDMYRASVWRYGNKLDFSYLVVSCGGENKFYRQAEAASSVESNGWELLELFFTIPENPKDLKVYVTKASSGDIFFDDLQIEKINSGKMLEAGMQDTAFSSLDLLLDYKALSKLDAKRQATIAAGILFSENDDWVKGDLVSEEGKIPVKVRLKGDWMDHLTGDKWSFRIATRQESSWNRLMTFSVQNPQTRNHLSEWVYHKMLEQEDVLTTRYDFIRFSINGEARGIYAYEEHFEKQLPEFKQRREGPILKFTEDGVWNARKRQLDFESQDIDIENTLNSFEASEPRPFSEGKTLKAPNLAEQFQLAQTLLQQYKFGLKPVNEVFDVDRLAKHYAIADVNQAYHNMVWHNQRFYYNPVISRLEPIGFDGFTGQGIFTLRGKAFMGAEIAGRTNHYLTDLLYNPFLEEAFVERYIYYLERYSRNSFLEKFRLTLEPEIKKREQLIQKEFPAYQYEFRPAAFAREIRNLLFPLNDNSIRAFTQEQDGEFVRLKVANYHVLPLRILGFGKKKSLLSDTLESPLFLVAHNRALLPDFHDLKAPNKAKYIFFELPGVDSLFYSPISPWSLPLPSVPAQDLFADASPVSNPLYLVEGKNIVFAPGKYSVDSAIVIPAGYHVRFEPGFSLDLLKGAFFLSRSPVVAIGTEDHPVRITSSDGTANGFTVLQAGERSVLEHIHFEGLNTLSQGGWNLTGAVTFYESDVDISHSAFVGNHCEDALNLVRCEFTMDHSLVSRTFADGFDADFCKGEVRNSLFSHTGNDCMDFSGSRITIVDCRVEASGDKGVSVGEEAHVIIRSLEVDGAVIGVASKDLSVLEIDDIILRNCETGFAAYQKKPEYGGAKITVKSYEAENVKRLHLIEKSSSLWLNGSEVEGI